jgi:hypothetical protein
VTSSVQVDDPWTSITIPQIVKDEIVVSNERNIDFYVVFQKTPM